MYFDTRDPHRYSGTDASKTTGVPSTCVSIQLIAAKSANARRLTPLGFAGVTSLLASNTVAVRM
ncbi:MAG: hypothetical protein EB027_08205 [Actinobacteria bacterium]|nr:hypothetical protein [Actinomycetota bacterium]